MKVSKLLMTACASLFFLAACQENGDLSPTNLTVEDELSKPDKARPKTMVWSDGILYESVVTPAEFDGNRGNYDRLYMGSFYDGVGLISESKPGDKDYNGGRWDVYKLKAGVNTDYSMATADTDLNLDDFESAETYFACPLLPRKGKK